MYILSSSWVTPITSTNCVVPKFLIYMVCLMNVVFLSYKYAYNDWNTLKNTTFIRQTMYIRNLGTTQFVDVIGVTHSCRQDVHNYTWHIFDDVTQLCNTNQMFIN